MKPKPKSEPVKKPVGRPPTDDSGPQKKRSVYLTDREANCLVERFGSIGGGVRSLVLDAIQKNPACENARNLSDS